MASPSTDRQPQQRRNDQEKQQQGHERQQGAIIAILLVLLAGLAVGALVSRLTAILVVLGVPPQTAAMFLAGLAKVGGLPVPEAPSAPAGSAVAIMGRGVPARRAMYLAAAARRLATGGSMKVEERLFEAHRAAERRRAEAAARIDRATVAHGPVLGWHAILDEKTTPLCRAAHGRNFRVDRPPQIGWPGTAHAGNCRCKPGAPWANGSMLP